MWLGKGIAHWASEFVKMVFARRWHRDLFAMWCDTVFFYLLRVFSANMRVVIASLLCLVAGQLTITLNIFNHHFKRSSNPEICAMAKAWLGANFRCLALGISFFVISLSYLLHILLFQKMPTESCMHRFLFTRPSASLFPRRFSSRPGVPAARAVAQNARHSCIIVIVISYWLLVIVVAQNARHCSIIVYNQIPKIVKLWSEK